MKDYRETYIRKAEIAQLILLYQLYSLPGSQDLIFRGGTALRWCYGGSRFSEDLDFVMPLPPETVKAKLMESAITGDLSRFLPPETLAVHKADGFSSLLNELQALFAELKKAEVALP